MMAGIASVVIWGFLEIRCYYAMLLSNKASFTCEAIQGGLIWRNDFSGGGLFKGALFKDLW